MYICTHTHIYIYILSTLAKELSVATSAVQSFSKELSTSVSGSVKYKQTEVNRYTSNSQDYVWSAAGYEALYRADIKLAGLRSSLKRHTEEF